MDAYVSFLCKYFPDEVVHFLQKWSRLFSPGSLGTLKVMCTRFAIFDACVLISRLLDLPDTWNDLCSYVSNRLFEFVTDSATPVDENIAQFQDRLKFVKDFILNTRFDQSDPHLILLVRAILVPLSAVSNDSKIVRIICSFFSEICIMLGPYLPVTNLIHDLRHFQLGDAFGIRSVLAAIIHYLDEAQTAAVLRQLFQKDEQIAFKTFVMQMESGLIIQQSCCDNMLCTRMEDDQHEALSHESLGSEDLAARVEFIERRLKRTSSAVSFQGPKPASIVVPTT
jgi:hypothetical protein